MSLLFVISSALIWPLPVQFIITPSGFINDYPTFMVSGSCALPFRCDLLTSTLFFVVSIRSFSMSVSGCKQDHLYQFFQIPHTNISIWYLFFSDLLHSLNFLRFWWVAAEIYLSCGSPEINSSWVFSLVKLHLPVCSSRRRSSQTWLPPYLCFWKELQATPTTSPGASPRPAGRAGPCS